MNIRHNNSFEKFGVETVLDTFGVASVNSFIAIMGIKLCHKEKYSFSRLTKTAIMGSVREKVSIFGRFSHWKERARFVVMSSFWIATDK